ncbi:YbaB/EbfC family nucleoid-associated protein [Amycolatopsis lurida]
MTTPGDDRARLEARNAAMKDRVDGLLEQFNRQTEQLREAQAAAAEASATVTSKDGLVRATIDANGVLSKLDFAPTAFERSGGPAALAASVLEVVRTGGLQVKQEVADLMSPLTEGMPDLTELFEDAPSLAGLVPSIPDFTPPEPEPRARPESFEEEGSIFQNRQQQAPPPPAAAAPPPPPPPPSMPSMPQPKPTTRRARPAPVEDEEEPPDSWLTRGNR